MNGGTVHHLLTLLAVADFKALGDTLHKWAVELFMGIGALIALSKWGRNRIEDLIVHLGAGILLVGPFVWLTPAAFGAFVGGLLGLIFR
jgi:hypothetical protein